jgi:hypothetical protein
MKPIVVSVSRFAEMANSSNGMTVIGPAIINNRSLPTPPKAKDASFPTSSTANQTKANGNNRLVSTNSPGIAPIATCFLITPYIVNNAARDSATHGKIPPLTVK